MKLYLAGTMSYYYNQNKPELAENWRTYFEKEFDCFNPCNNFKTNINFDCRGVVYQNIHYLDKCDVIIVNLQDLKESAGTIFEIYYAFLNHKPVIAFGNSELYNQPHVHESITMKFNYIGEVKYYLSKMYS